MQIQAFICIFLNVNVSIFINILFSYIGVLKHEEALKEMAKRKSNQFFQVKSGQLINNNNNRMNNPGLTRIKTNAQSVSAVNKGTTKMCHENSTMYANYRYVYVYIYIYVSHTYICVYIYVSHIYTYTYHMYIYIHIICICIYTYTYHRYIYTYIHICIFYIYT
jgi:hypothetical protein